MTTTATPPVTIVPANEASWEDLQAVFGTRGDPSRCYCQRYKMQPGESWASVGAEELAFRLRMQTDCDHPESGYPMITEPGREIALPGELHVGSRDSFVDAGLTEVAHPTLRRVVMRIDFDRGGDE